MSLASFKSAPWKTHHAAYKDSAFAISPAPEYASSEVLVAALYRVIGLESLGEGDVPRSGRDFDKRLRRGQEKGTRPVESTVSASTWNTVVHGVLESPKLPNQSSKRFLQMTPVVPEIARYSGSARLSANSWPAGQLVRRMVWLGSESPDKASELWQELFAALSVTDHDDVFARWLQGEFVAWGEGTATTWHRPASTPPDIAAFHAATGGPSQYPARQFVRDLRSVISAKEWMTRRQWTSLLEAVIRLAAVAHVVWLCEVQDRLWRVVLGVLDGELPASEPALRERIFPNALQYMTYGNTALPTIRDRASRYLLARLGLNAVLWGLREIQADFSGGLSTSADFYRLSESVASNRAALVARGVRQSINDVREQEARTLLCRSGIGKNLIEFARHVLGQRQTASDILRGYDQGYVLRKKGEHASAPLVVSLGPVAVIALVHCCLDGMGGARSVHRLCQHLAAYGISIDRNDIAKNDLGQKLRMLGLVLDSPDAESGMLLLPPFTHHGASKRGMPA